MFFFFFVFFFSERALIRQTSSFHVYPVFVFGCRVGSSSRASSPLEALPPSLLLRLLVAATKSRPVATEAVLHSSARGECAGLVGESLKF